MVEYAGCGLFALQNLLCQVLWTMATLLLYTACTSICHYARIIGVTVELVWKITARKGQNFHWFLYAESDTAERKSDMEDKSHPNLNRHDLEHFKTETEWGHTLGLGAVKSVKAFVLASLLSGCVAGLSDCITCAHASSMSSRSCLTTALSTSGKARATNEDTSACAECSQASCTIRSVSKSRKCTLCSMGHASDAVAKLQGKNPSPSESQCWCYIIFEHQRIKGQNARVRISLTTGMQAYVIIAFIWDSMPAIWDQAPQLVL